MQRFMVIERFRKNAMSAVYDRFEAHGRKLPAGLHYIDSWLSSEREVCYQLMETENPALFEKWMTHWVDLVDFEIVPLDS